MYFDSQFYAMGYEHALDDIETEGIEQAKRLANNLTQNSEYIVGYRTAIGVYEEGAAQ